MPPVNSAAIETPRARAKNGRATSSPPFARRSLSTGTTALDTAPSASSM